MCIRDRLWSLDAGTDRETWVKVAMSAKANGLAFEDFHEWSATAGNYRNEAECRSVWQSIKAVSYTHLDVYKRQVLITAYLRLPEPRNTEFGMSARR